MDSYDLLYALKKAGYCATKRDKLWWHNSGSFEVVIGAILAQNTKYKNVEKALLNLKSVNILDLDSIVNIDTKALAILIKPAGFYNTKAKYIKKLALNIKKDFDNFDNFYNTVTREWLLSQKGIGFESGDSILCYACHRDEMVADTYSYRILLAFGIEMNEYEDVKSFLTNAIDENLENIYTLYGEKLSLNAIYARFHGKIVEYCADNSSSKTVDIEKLKIILQKEV